MCILRVLVFHCAGQLDAWAELGITQHSMIDTACLCNYASKANEMISQALSVYCLM